MLSPFRKLLKRVHPEGIPWPATVLYNLVSSTNIFQRHYRLAAKDIGNYCSAGSLLDIGTGPGWLLMRIHNQLPDLRVTGLDVSSSMVAKARENIEKAGLSGVIEMQEGRADALPFDDNTFDVVVSTGSIHHWKQPEAGLNEVRRVLKPGGYALIYDIVSDTPKAVLQSAKQEFGRFRIFMLWIHTFEEPFYSTQDFTDLPKATLFREGQTWFVGVMCCLTLKNTKEEDQ
jgi:ubiquinone/menaquinone biosynthesis C-methylase UbiE